MKRCVDGHRSWRRSMCVFCSSCKCIWCVFVHGRLSACNHRACSSVAWGAGIFVCFISIKKYVSLLGFARNSVFDRGSAIYLAHVVVDVRYRHSCVDVLAQCRVLLHQWMFREDAGIHQRYFLQSQSASTAVYLSDIPHAMCGRRSSGSNDASGTHGGVPLDTSGSLPIL